MTNEEILERASDYVGIGYLNGVEYSYINPCLLKAIDAGIIALREQAKIVKCKNCIYQKDAKVNCKGFAICPASNMEITDDDYCSYGKRRESEGNT